MYSRTLLVLLSLYYLIYYHSILSLSLSKYRD